MIVKLFLGIRICHHGAGISMTKTSYVEKVLDRFNMADSKAKNAPLSGGENLKPLAYPQDKDDNYQDEFTYIELIGCLL